jgi:hypothetical protein
MAVKLHFTAQLEPVSGLLPVLNILPDEMDDLQRNVRVFNQSVFTNIYRVIRTLLSPGVFTYATVYFQPIILKM